MEQGLIRQAYSCSYQGPLRYNPTHRYRAVRKSEIGDPVVSDGKRLETLKDENGKFQALPGDRIFEVEDDIIDQRDQMVADLQARLEQDISKQKLFGVRGSVV